MGITAERLKELKLVDRVIEEPLGGAHRNIEETARRLKAELIQNLDRLNALDTETLVEQRYKRLTAYVKD